MIKPDSVDSENLYDFRILSCLQGGYDSLEHQARIVEFDGEYSLEVIYPSVKGFFHRLQIAIAFLLQNRTVYLSSFPLPLQSIKELSSFVNKSNL